MKILLFDTKGRAVEDNQYRCAVTLRTSRDGASEVAPDELLDIVWRGIDAVLAESARWHRRWPELPSVPLSATLWASIERQGR